MASSLGDEGSGGGAQENGGTRNESHLEQLLLLLVALHLGTQDGGAGPQGERQAQEGFRLAPAQAQGADLDHGVPLRLGKDACTGRQGGDVGT